MGWTKLPSYPPSCPSPKYVAHPNTKNNEVFPTEDPRYKLRTYENQIGVAVIEVSTGDRQMYIGDNPKWVDCDGNQKADLLMSGSRVEWDFRNQH